MMNDNTSHAHAAVSTSGDNPAAPTKTQPLRTTAKRPRTKANSAKKASAPKKRTTPSRQTVFGEKFQPLIPPEEKQETVDAILALIADGYSLPQIEEKTGVHRQTVNAWLVKNTHGVGIAYAQAREARADRIAREIFDIADNAPDDNPAAVNKARLQVDTRKWYLSKILPEKYGDAQRIELSGRNGGAIGVVSVGATAIEEVRRMRDLLFGAIDAEVKDFKTDENA